MKRAAWFRPMRYGAGAYPANARGWSAVAAVVGVVSLWAVAVFGWGHDPEESMRALAWSVVRFLGGAGLLTIGFLVLVGRKTSDE